MTPRVSSCTGAHHACHHACVLQIDSEPNVVAVKVVMTGQIASGISKTKGAASHRMICATSGSCWMALIKKENPKATGAKPNNKRHNSSPSGPQPTTLNVASQMQWVYSTIHATRLQPRRSNTSGTLACLAMRNFLGQKSFTNIFQSGSVWMRM